MVDRGACNCGGELVSCVLRLGKSRLARSLRSADCTVAGDTQTTAVQNLVVDLHEARSRLSMSC